MSLALPSQTPRSEQAEPGRRVLLQARGHLSACWLQMETREKRLGLGLPVAAWSSHL